MHEKILVRGVNWIGDAVMTLPALRALRKAHPGARISLLVKPSVAPVFERNPFIDEIILYDGSGIGGRLTLARRLRKERFESALLLQNAFDAALLTWLSGIPERIGYDRDGRGMLLTRRIPFKGDDRRVHHIDYYLNLLRATGLAADHSLPWIYLALDERLAARKRLGNLKRPILGINPGAAYGSAKRWLPEKFAEVARWFMEDTGGSVAIFGGDNEADISLEIEFLIGRRSEGPSSPPSLGKAEAEGDGPRVVNLAGKTSLRELAALISECDVFLSNDSGPMHMAYAVGAPLVALFGSTSPELTGPVGEGNRVIKAALSCSPCFERTCEEGGLRCMEDISSDDVFLAIKKLLPEMPAVFFDRDGTLCEDMNYLKRREDLRLLPGIEELGRLKAGGFALIGVTNQSGVARGLVEEGFVQEINRLFINRFGFDGFFYCPHHPDEHCSCRKPEPEMAYRARAAYRIDLRKSYVVGDKEADMILAGSVGARGILVRTGHEESIQTAHADFEAGSLQEAVEYILASQGEKT